MAQDETIDALTAVLINLVGDAIFESIEGHVKDELKRLSRSSHELRGADKEQLGRIVEETVDELMEDAFGAQYKNLDKAVAQFIGRPRTDVYNAVREAATEVIRARTNFRDDTEKVLKQVIKWGHWD